MRDTEEVSLFRHSILGFITDERNAKLGRVDASLRQVAGMSCLGIVKWWSKFSGKIRSQNGMRSPALEHRPTIGGVGNMGMEERQYDDPSDQPCQDRQTPMK